MNNYRENKNNCICYFYNDFVLRSCGKTHIHTQKKNHKTVQMTDKTKESKTNIEVDNSIQRENRSQ